MKANAPEKIYVERILCTDEVYDTWKSEKTISDDIEYIRTDVFIDKAAGWLSDNTLSGLCLDLGNVEIVREFVDNFRNYMKGE